MANILTDKPADLYQEMLGKGFQKSFVLGMAVPHVAAMKNDDTTNPRDIIALERLIDSIQTVVQNTCGSEEGILCSS